MSSSGLDVFQVRALSFFMVLGGWHIHNTLSKLQIEQDHGLIPGVKQHYIIRNRFEKANAVERKTENH